MFEQRLDLDPEQAALDLALGDELFGHAAGEVPWNGAAQAQADFIDPNDFPAQIHQRPARVAPIDRRVVPEPAHQQPDVLSVELHPAEGSEKSRHHHLVVADDAQGDRLREGHRAAHRQHVVADPHLAGVAEDRHRKHRRGAGFELDDRDVGERIGAHQLGFEVLAVGQGAEEPGAMSGHMMIGDQMAFLADNRAAADALLFLFASFAVVSGHHLNPDERGLDSAHGSVHRRAQTVRWPHRANNGVGEGDNDHHGQAELRPTNGRGNHGEVGWIDAKGRGQYLTFDHSLSLPSWSKVKRRFSPCAGGETLEPTPAPTTECEP